LAFAYFSQCSISSKFELKSDATHFFYTDFTSIRYYRQRENDDTSTVSAWQRKSDAPRADGRDNEEKYRFIIYHNENSRLWKIFYSEPTSARQRKSDASRANGRDFAIMRKNAFSGVPPGPRDNRARARTLDQEFALENAATRIEGARDVIASLGKNFSLFWQKLFPRFLRTALFPPPQIGKSPPTTARKIVRQRHLGVSA